MKSRDTLIRLKRFHVDEKRRRVSQIESMIADFQRMATDLDREIEGEERKAGISDPAHFAYPTYAKAAAHGATTFCNPLPTSMVQLEDAKAALSEAFEELKKVEILEDREKAAERAEMQLRDQIETDRIAARMRFAAGRL